MRSLLFLAIFLVFGCVPAEEKAMYSDIQNGVDFCRLTVTSSSTSGRIYYSFLRRDAGAAGTPFWLYQSAWDRHGQLEHCDATGDQALIYTYLSLCRKDGRGNFSDIQTDSRIDTSILSGPASPCATKSLPEWGMETAGRAKRDLEDAQLGHIPPVQSSGHIAPPSKSLQRKKRSWIIPGTLWCGTGSTAANYADLGVFEQTDNCCREHDHCKATMTAFQFKYGAFNHNLFTVSHCECDQSFRQCLLGVNDTVSNLVGYGFFNILKVPCFVFTPTQQCVQLYWWGRCKISKVAPHALFQTPTPYNSTHPSEEKTDMGWNPEDNDTDIQATTKNRVFATNTSTPAPAVQDVTSGKPSRRRQPGKHRQGDRQKNRGRGDSSSSPSKGRGDKGRKNNCLGQPSSVCRREGGATRTSPGPVFPGVTGRGDAPSNTSDLLSHGFENALPMINPWTPPTNGGSALNRPAPMQDSKERHKWQSCSCYKHLDQCPLKIAPQEVRFGLQNPETKTLYHCDCTRRMAKQLRRLRQWNDVQSLLFNYISMSCFQVPEMEKCNENKGCLAVLSRATHLERALRGRGDQAGGTFKVKRQNARQAKSKAIPVKLYNRCLRIIDSKRPK